MAQENSQEQVTEEPDRFGDLLDNVDFTFYEDRIREDSDKALRGILKAMYPFRTEERITEMIEGFARRVIDMKKAQRK